MLILPASTVVTTPPASEPVGLTEMKNFAKVRITDDDFLLSGLITAAREAVEAFLRRKLITQSLTLRYDGGFPPEIRPPFVPIQSVTSVKHLDDDGVEQTLVAGTDYEVDTDSEPARIRAAFETEWPTTRRTFNAVRVEVVAGYGDDADDVPELFRLAVMQAALDTYENRGSEILTVGGTVVKIARSVENMLLPHVFHFPG